MPKPLNTKLITLLFIIVIIISIGVSYTFYTINLRHYESLRKEIPRLNKSLSGVLTSVMKSLENINEDIKKLTGNVESLGLRLNEISKIKEELIRLKAKLVKINSSISELVSKEDLNSIIKRIKNVEKRIEGLASISDVVKLKESLEELSRELNELLSITQFPISVVDATGDVVVIPERPTRIVSLLPSVTEILFSIGAGKQVIGVDEYSNYPPEVVEAVKNGSIANIGSGWYPNIEKILSLNPDLIIGVDSVVSHHTLKEIFSREGIPLILLPDRTLNDVVESIVIVGKATGNLIKAKKVALDVRSNISSMRNLVLKSIASRGKPKVAVLVWLNPLWVVGNGTWLHDLITFAGGINVFENLSGWISVSPEALIKASPDIIIITHVCGNASYALNILKELLGEGFKLVPALANGYVYCIRGSYNDALVRPGPRITLALKLLIAIIHPEAYGLSRNEIPNDLDPSTFSVYELS